MNNEELEEWEIKVFEMINEEIKNLSRNKEFSVRN